MLPTVHRSQGMAPSPFTVSSAATSDGQLAMANVLRIANSNLKITTKGSM